MITTAGIFPTHLAAGGVLNELRVVGVPETDLSYVYMDTAGTIQDHMVEAKINEGAAAGATAGTIAGTIAGIAVANGIIPGLGALFVAGPLATALGLTGAAATTAAGAATGLAVGGLIGALGGMGINAADAALYQALVQKGDVLVIARTKDLVTKEVFLKGGAMEVREYIS